MHTADDENSTDQDKSSVSGSRGMLQRMKKNIVTPVDMEPSRTESPTTRINVTGKRTGRCLYL